MGGRAMRGVAAAVCLLAGCSAPGPAVDPETGRLETGQAVILFSRHEDKTTIFGTDGVLTRVPVGTRATVLSDDTQFAPGANPTPEDRRLVETTRDVRVSVSEGEHAGLVGRIDRDQLRPVPK